MHPSIPKLYELAEKGSRLIIGLMSGTSLDGLDIALCKVTGSGPSTQIELVQFQTVSYTNEFKDKLLAIFSKQNVSLEQLTLLNPWLAKQHAGMVNVAIAQWGLKNDQIDLIASHGQTIYHAPKSLHPNDEFGTATLQIGDGDHLAVATGIITLSDFRQKHIAAGGDGAPLAVYGDYLVAVHPTENRLLLNIGGIANYTYLPANCSLSEVFSTDTGPGNIMMDAFMRAHFMESFDKNGEVASSGVVNKNLLAVMESHSFFKLGMPKTIGPELFNLAFIKTTQAQSNTVSIAEQDMMATLNNLTANSIVNAIQLKIPKDTNYTIYVSGGGLQNIFLMENISKLVPNIKIKSSLDIGLQPDAKEAILFALLANECIAGDPMFAGGKSTKIPISMGKISFPY